MSATVEKTKAELDDAIQELTESKERLKLADARQDRATQQLKEILGENAATKKALEEKEGEIEGLNTELAAGKGELAEARLGAKRTEERVAVAEKAMAQAQAKVNASEGLKLKLSDENRDLHSQLNAELMKKEELSAELERLNVEASELRKVTAELKEENATLQQQTKEANSDAESLQQVFEKVVEQQKSLSEKYVQAVRLDKDVFGSEIRDFAFPAPGAENIVVWFDSLRSFFVLLGSELEVHLL